MKKYIFLNSDSEEDKNSIVKKVQYNAKCINKLSNNNSNMITCDILKEDTKVDDKTHYNGIVPIFKLEGVSPTRNYPKMNYINHFYNYNNANVKSYNTKEESGLNAKTQNSNCFPTFKSREEIMHWILTSEAPCLYYMNKHENILKQKQSLLEYNKTDLMLRKRKKIVLCPSPNTNEKKSRVICDVDKTDSVTLKNPIPIRKINPVCNEIVSKTDTVTVDNNLLNKNFNTVSKKKYSVNVPIKKGIDPVNLNGDTKNGHKISDSCSSVMTSLYINSVKNDIALNNLKSNNSFLNKRSAFQRAIIKLNSNSNRRKDKIHQDI